MCIVISCLNLPISTENTTARWLGVTRRGVAAQLIYNGDADACVPYIGNEEWINDALVGPGLVSEAEAWRPWFTAETPDMPAGYVTTYNVVGASPPVHTMTFLTIRLAGHSESAPHRCPPAPAARTCGCSYLRRHQPSRVEVALHLTTRVAPRPHACSLARSGPDVPARPRPDLFRALPRGRAAVKPA